MKKKKLFLMLLLAPFAMALSQTEDNAEAEGTNRVKKDCRHYNKTIFDTLYL